MIWIQFGSFARADRCRQNVAHKIEIRFVCFDGEAASMVMADHFQRVVESHGAENIQVSFRSLRLTEPKELLKDQDLIVFLVNDSTYYPQVMEYLNTLGKTQRPEVVNMAKGAPAWLLSLDPNIYQALYEYSLLNF